MKTGTARMSTDATVPALSRQDALLYKRLAAQSGRREDREQEREHHQLDGNRQASDGASNGLAET